MCHRCQNSCPEEDIDEQLKHRVCTLEKTVWGIRRFIYGLAKKVIISNILAQCVDTFRFSNLSMRMPIP